MKTHNKRAHPACNRMGSIDSASRLIDPSIPEDGMDALSVIDLSGYVHDPAMGEVTVCVHQYGYLVTGDPRMIPRFHHVYAGACNCRFGPNCPAVRAVAQYLQDGGRPAPTPPEEFFPNTPWACPVCGARAARADQLSSQRRGQGWVCAAHGESHYWEHHSAILRQCRTA